MRFKVKITTQSTIAELERVEARTNNLAIPFVNYGRWFVKQTDKQFDRGVDPDNVPWVKLKPSTLARKKALGYSQKILIARGDTRNTLAHKATKTGVEVYIEGTAEYHQYGTRRIPERRIIGVNQERLDKLEELLTNWIQGAIK